MLVQQVMKESLGCFCPKYMIDFHDDHDSFLSGKSLLFFSTKMLP